MYLNIATKSNREEWERGIVAFSLRAADDKE